jgi:hypothetical protein
MRVRGLLVISAIAVGFSGGVVTSRLLERDARAQSIPFAATVYVPSDGLAFRTFDGHVVARLSYDAHGGIFEVYDEGERVAARVRGEPLARKGAPPPSPSPTAATGRGNELDLGI